MIMRILFALLCSAWVVAAQEESGPSAYDQCPGGKRRQARGREEGTQSGNHPGLG
jgi:hypothetical protein